MSAIASCLVRLRQRWNVDGMLVLAGCAAFWATVAFVLARVFV